MAKKFLAIFCFVFLFYPKAHATDISLKISADKRLTFWGDYILGRDLQKGLERIGYTVQPAYSNDYYPEGSDESTVDIYMHGYIPFNPRRTAHKTNVMYLYYPLETANTHKYQNLVNVTEPDWYSLQTELWNFDLIAVASPSYKKEIDTLGIPTIFAPQFTNPKKFFYEYDKDKAYDVLFVGRPGYERISAKWAIECGFDVALFGGGWQTKAPRQYIKGDFIDNNELHKYYSSATIVLNDTREDMKKNGFISNRVFDVTASGGFLISDYMPEIEQFYGDSIPMFETKEELCGLIDYYLKHPEERHAKAQKAQEITLKYFTNTAVAQKIMSALSDKKPNNKLILKSPLGRKATDVGDYWLKLDLEEGLKNNGFDVKRYDYENRYMKDGFYDEADNLLYLQFKYQHLETEDINKAKIMYLYFPTFIPEKGKFKNTEDTFHYNTDAFLNNELDYFDMIATPAKATYEQLHKRGYHAAFVPQFTNPKKFKYSPREELKTDLLFVGSTWYERVSVKYALENGYDIAVYGLGWKGKIPDKYLKGDYIDNPELPKYYSSAKIVLSDHAEDLAKMGLVINRLYDATAVGAFVISEYSPYIEEIFGDSIPMFKNKNEFKTLVDYYLSHPEARMKKASQAQAITLNNYTNDHVGLKLKHLFNHIHEMKK